MKSGLPSAVSATAPARVVRERRVAEELLRRARGSSSSVSGSSGSAVYAGSPPPQPGRSVEELRPRERERTGPGRRARARRASRAGRAGSRRPSGCPRTGAASGRACASDSTRTRAEKKSVSRSRDRRCRRRARGASRGAARAPPPPPGPASVGDRGGELLAAPRRARRCRRCCAICFTCWPNALYGRARAVRRRATADDAPALVAPRAARARARAATCRCPAGPKTVTKCAPPLVGDALPDARRARRARARARSSGPRRRGRSPMRRGRAEARARRWTGALLALRDDRLGGSVLDGAARAAYVSSPTRTAPTGAADWRRAAVLTTSPATMRLAVRRDARRARRSPRPCSRRCAPGGPSCSAQSRTANAARTARSASSPYARRRAEDAHDRVADELLDRAAEALELARAPARSTA